MTDDGNRRRRELAYAGWRVIAAQGLAGASMRAIAREAGCTTGSLTHHFRDRQDLLDFALDLVFQDSTARVATALEAGLLADALAELLPLDEQRRLEGAVWLAQLAAAQHDPALAAALVRRSDEAYTALREAFRVRLAELGRTLEPADLHLLVDEILSAVDGVAVYALADPSSFPPARQLVLVDRILQRVGLRG